MDMETQKRYAGAMQKLINEVSQALDIDISQYVYDTNHDTHQTITEDEATDEAVQEFISSGQNLGSLGLNYGGADLRDFFKWLMGEVFNRTSGKNNPYSIYDRPQSDTRDLSTMTDAEWQAWLKEERKTREDCSLLEKGGMERAMRDIIFGRV